MRVRKPYTQIHVQRRCNKLESEIRLSLVEFKLLRTAIGICCADETDHGKSLQQHYKRILNKLNRLIK